MKNTPNYFNFVKGYIPNWYARHKQQIDTEYVTFIVIPPIREGALSKGLDGYLNVRNRPGLEKIAESGIETSVQPQEYIDNIPFNHLITGNQASILG